MALCVHRFFSGVWVEPQGVWDTFSLTVFLSQVLFFLFARPGLIFVEKLLSPPLPSKPVSQLSRLQRRGPGCNAMNGSGAVRALRTLQGRPGGRPPPLAPRVRVGFEDPGRAELPASLR